MPAILYPAGTGVGALFPSINTGSHVQQDSGKRAHCLQVLGTSFPWVASTWFIGSVESSKFVCEKSGEEGGASTQPVGFAVRPIP